MLPQYVYAKDVVCTQPITAMVVLFWLSKPNSQHLSDRVTKPWQHVYSNIDVAALQNTAKILLLWSV